MARNKNKGAPDSKELPRSSSAEHHTSHVGDPTNNAVSDEFTVMPGAQAKRDAGRSVNPISRGNNNLRSGFDNGNY